MIELESITFAYPGQEPVFEAFSWQVERGDMWAVIGPSGCGKSTLLYLLAGLRRPTGGEVRVGGQPLARPRPATGLVLQDYGLLPWATVADNAALGLRIRRFYGPDSQHAPVGERLRAREIGPRVDHWLERLGISELGDKYPAQISGGQRQRTAIARTLALEPDLLLMDEPFSSLDAVTREDLERQTVELCAETGLTTVVVTHNIEEAVFMGTQLLVLRQPPHREALILENRGAGQQGHRGSEAFRERWNDVRHLLGTAQGRDA